MADQPDHKTPTIQKLGTLTCDLVETTPLVYRDRLYRFESVRARYRPNTTGDAYFRLIDVDSGQPTPAFAQGCHLGCAYAVGDTMYAYGVPGVGAEELHVFWSDDLEHWSSQPALHLPGWTLFNSSVCRGPDGYVMAFEVGEPAELVGTRFTNFFARSDDLVNWQVLGPDHVFDTRRYTACPTIRFVDGFYYVLYLEDTRDPQSGAEQWETWLARSRDLKQWDLSPMNPVLKACDKDRRMAVNFSSQEQERIRTAVNTNNSDMDLCEFEGSLVINYSWGNQHGIEHLAEARFAGSLHGFFSGYFP